jgi:predicted transcriptional regulator
MTAVNVAFGCAFPRSNKVGWFCSLTSYSAEATTPQTVAASPMWRDACAGLADGESAPKVDPGLVAEIVRSYVANNSIPAAQLGELIATVHRSLSRLGEERPSPVPLVPAVPIRRSVQPDHVVCLECGFRAQTLRRHLRIRHGLDVPAYRARWKLSPDHPVTAPAYSARRSMMAKKIGLGRKPAVQTPTPRRRRRPRRAATE